MERSQLFDLMGELKLYGMKAAFDEIMATAVKRQHEPQRIIGDLLKAEIGEKQARSIKYQLTIAKLPLAKDLAEFKFEGTPINQTLVHDLAAGGFIAQQRNAVLVGGTGTGKSHLAIAIARNFIRSRTRGPFYNVVHLVNRLETESRNGRQGRLRNPDQLRRRERYRPDSSLKWVKIGRRSWVKIGCRLTPIRYKWGLILGYDSAVKAGRARMNSMSKEEKSEFQSKAAKARWSKHNNSNTRGVAHG